MKTKLAFRHKKDEIKGPYRYTACGLDNVYAEWVRVVSVGRRGRSVGTRLGGFTSRYWALSGKAGPAPTQGTPLVPFAYWTQDKLAEILACAPEAVTQWEKGECAPSEKNDMFIRLLYLDHIDDGAEFQTLLERLRQWPHNRRLVGRWIKPPLSSSLLLGARPSWPPAGWKPALLTVFSSRGYPVCILMCGE